MQVKKRIKNILKKKVKEITDTNVPRTKLFCPLRLAGKCSILLIPNGGQRRERERERERGLLVMKRKIGGTERKIQGHTHSLTH